MRIHTVPSLFDRFFDEAFAPAPVARPFRPALDLIEYPDRYEVVADLPGIDQKEVEVEFIEGVLHVRGERSGGFRDDDPLPIARDIRLFSRPGDRRWRRNRARVAEWVDAGDLKSPGFGRAGSTPAPGTSARPGGLQVNSPAATLAFSSHQLATRPGEN